jgi:hypothetical protein
MLGEYLAALGLYYDHPSAFAPNREPRFLLIEISKIALVIEVQEIQVRRK